MNILISGGTGLVGKELGKALAVKGHKIFILTRSKEKADFNCPFPQTAIEYSELATHPILPELDAIINLAGANLMDKRWNKKFKELIRSSRIETTKNLVQLANNHCPKLQAFISTSAIGIYGNTGDVIVNEEHSQSYEFLGKVCQDWEAPVEELKNIRSVILRVGIVFSEKGGALAEMTTPIQSGFGGPLSNGQQSMSWIDIDDLIGLYVFALENNIQGTYNAVAPNPATNKEITETIATHLNKSAPFKVPFFALRLVVGEMAKHLIEDQKISSQKIQNKGYQFQFKNIKASIKERIPQLRSFERRMIFEQWVPEKKEEVFSFFSEAKNLERITPDNLHFKILSSSTEKIEKNTTFDYKLRIDGIPVKWRTLITDWNPPHHFADNQEKGPYRKWYHQHFFMDLAGGTLMIDQVDLEIPMGALGYAAASWKVLKDVKKIFKYRTKVIFDLYKGS